MDIPLLVGGNRHEIDFFMKLGATTGPSEVLNTWLTELHRFKSQDSYRCFVKSLEAAQWEGDEPAESDFEAKRNAADSMTSDIFALALQKSPSVYRYSWEQIPSSGTLVKACNDMGHACAWTRRPRPQARARPNAPASRKRAALRCRRHRQRHRR